MDKLYRSPLVRFGSWVKLRNKEDTLDIWVNLEYAVELSMHDCGILCITYTDKKIFYLTPYSIDEILKPCFLVINKRDI